MPVDTVTLASGHGMPLVGFGLWKVPANKASDIVYNAIKVGYRLFDGAYDYGNEKEAGEGVRRAMSEGLVKREEIFITTKLWNNYHRREHVLEMAKLQNEAWGLGYLDLFLIHYPVSLEYIDPSVRPFCAWWMDDDHKIVKSVKVPFQETWQAMEEVVNSGIARSIGVSNVQGQTLYDILSYARHPISSLQIEHHPYLVQPDLIALAQENNIVVTGYSTFGPQSWLELPSPFSDRARNLPTLFETKEVQDAARRGGKTSAQVLLRWATQRGIAVIPKSNSLDRLKQNLEVIDFDLSKEELDAITALDRGLRINNPAYYLNTPLRIFA